MPVVKHKVPFSFTHKLNLGKIARVAIPDSTSAKNGGSVHKKKSLMSVTKLALQVQCVQIFETLYLEYEQP